MPRGRHGEWGPPRERPDPVELLEGQAAHRVAELVPIRHARMAASPFAFFRGAAVVMAHDLGREPRTSLDVQLCGDAHLMNFGGFATPDRSLVFDVNDFDETLRGPFEWDLKRLAASFDIAGRERGYDLGQRGEIVGAVARAYRQAIRDFARQPLLQVWYARLGLDDIEARWGRQAGKEAVKSLRRSATRATTKDHLKALASLTKEIDGEIRFKSDPPLLVPASELVSDAEWRGFWEAMAGSIRSYRRTLAKDRRHLLDHYHFVDLARKVVGVGSVGTRCWVALLLGRGGQDPLFLQVKEAQTSVLEPYLPKPRVSNHGQRVVEGQQLMQAAGDIFLGWDRVRGVDGVSRDFYMRQLWDWKVSANVHAMSPEVLEIYAQICGWTLARAHARSGDPVAIAAYLGSSEAFDRAMMQFAAIYGKQNKRDHRALCDAIQSKRIESRRAI